MKALLQRHSLLAIYIVVFIFLCIGVFVDSGTTYFGYLLVFFASLIISYIVIYNVIERYFSTKKPSFINKFGIPDKYTHYLAFSIFLISIMFFIYHLINLGYVPALTAFKSRDPEFISELRRLVTANDSPLMNYFSSFLIKGIIPFMLLYFFHKKQKILFYVLLLTSAFYVLSLLHKSYIVTIMLPVLFYAIFSKKYIQAGLHVLIILLFLVALVYISNPRLRGGEVSTIRKELPKNDKGVITGLSERVFLTPGKIVSDWFKVIPSKEPFLYGNGYNFLRPFGFTYVDYATLLYKDIYPEYAKCGVSGSVNTASFMYDYSNFGLIGLIISGFFMSIVLLIILNIFKDAGLYVSLPLNIYYILVLSSSALTTLLFSGGWGLVTLLFVVFKKQFVSKNSQ